MAFPTRLLVDDEELILDLRPHPIALAMPALVTVVTLGAAIWISAAFDWKWWIPWGGLALVLIVYVLPKFLNWWTSNFAVTSDRIIHRMGWISKYSMEIPLEAINDVRFEQGILDRMVGAGTLVIQSASEQGRQVFEDIRHPEDVQKTIYHQGELNKKRMYQGGGGTSSPAAPTATSELERLAKLHADGVLTDEEFAAQKAKILGQG
jgi:membrane protein YdbS with pleckstrin-like domain